MCGDYGDLPPSTLWRPVVVHSFSHMSAGTVRSFAELVVFYGETGWALRRAWCERDGPGTSQHNRSFCRLTDVDTIHYLVPTVDNS